MKEEITRICEYADFFQMRRENGFKDVLPAMHMLFTGNPDTGIHAVAKILEELFVSYGFFGARAGSLLQPGKIGEGRICGRRAIVA